MLRIAVLLLTWVAICSAYPSPFGGYPHAGGYPYYWGNWGYPSYHGYNNNYGSSPYGNRMVFYGNFPGSCEDKSDGLYYVDDRNFAYCFSGQKSIQPCAEGSANPPVGYFNHGGHYGAYDFCSVNLVARGYGPYHAAAAPAYGYHDKGAAYKSEIPSKTNDGYYGDRNTYKTESYGQGADGYKETNYQEEYKQTY